MSRFEKFATEQDLMERIEQLRKDGFEETDITVISSQKLENAYLKFRSINFKHSEGTTWDKFVSMFSDDDPKDKVLGAFDITDSEKEHFKHALDRQEILLLKESHKTDAQDESRQYHETQQQDTQAMETEAAENERIDAHTTATESAGRHSYDHGSDTESDRLHTADEDDRFDSLHSSKASTKAAGGSRAGGPKYEEEADRAIRDDITLDSERDDVKDDNDITLKDTESDEYNYNSMSDDGRKDDSHKKSESDTPGKTEYDYNSDEEYDYK